MKKILIITCLFLFPLTTILAAKAKNNEVTWENLKTLEIDASTKKQKMSPELTNALKKALKIKGFMMPLEYDAKEISEFLLMPYVPTCMHIPPPPANQLILVKMKKGKKIKPTFLPVEVEGNLKVLENKELESSYQMEGLSAKEIKETDNTNNKTPVHP